MERLACTSQECNVGAQIRSLHTICSFREDLLDPDKQVQSAPVIVDDGSSIDPTIAYFQSEHPNLPSRMTVGELKKALESDDSNKFCLDRSQREAFYHALSHPLTVIQVTSLFIHSYYRSDIQPSTFS